MKILKFGAWISESTASQLIQQLPTDTVGMTKVTLSLHVSKSFEGKKLSHFSLGKCSGNTNDGQG